MLSQLRRVQEREVTRNCGMMLNQGQRYEPLTFISKNGKGMLGEHHGSIVSDTCPTVPAENRGNRRFFLQMHVQMSGRLIGCLIYVFILDKSNNLLEPETLAVETEVSKSPITEIIAMISC